VTLAKYNLHIMCHPFFHYKFFVKYKMASVPTQKLIPNKQIAAKYRMT